MLAIALPLLAMLLMALMVPLLAAYAADRTQDQFVGRLGDVARFAVLAEDAIEDDDVVSLESELRRYTEVYGGSVVVTDANRGRDECRDRPQPARAPRRRSPGP